MKKSKLLKLLSGAIMFFLAMGFTSCVDDNEDLGMPYLEVSPTVLKFDVNGNAIGDSEFIVKSNRPWSLDIPADAQWVRASATSGDGDGVVSFNLFASSVGQTAQLAFQLKNSAGYVYMEKLVTIEQGDAPKPGPVGELVQWIIEKAPAAGPLNYPVEEIDAVILANNVYGNNFGKLYVGDNTTLPNSGMILYSTSDYNKTNSVNYPVGKKVKLNLKEAEYAPYQNLRELKGVKVTVLDEDPVQIVYPTLSASTFLQGKYQGQYVKVLNVTPQAAFVGSAWAIADKRAVKMTAEGGAELQSYMATATDATDFATMIIAAKTGAIYGAAEQIGTTIQIIPTKPEDVAELSEGGDQPGVSTGGATNVTATTVTLAGSSRNIDAASEVGFEYKVATAADWTKKAAAAAAASWTVDIEGLTADTKYAYRAYAVAAGQTYYGTEADFTTKGTSDADIFVDFTDLSGYPSGFPTSKGTTDLATYKFGGYDFTFFGKINTDKGGYYSSTYDKATVLIWGQDGAYIGLPAIAGKSLTKVVCTVPDGASAAVQVGVFDAAGTPVNGGEAITWTKNADPRVYTYNLSGTADNTSYRLQVVSKHNSQLAELELYYSTGGAPEQPKLSPATASMEFEAAADATGKTQVYTLEHAEGLQLFADVADKTNFSAAVENGNTVRVKTLTANDGAARTTTVTAYLAESAGGERKATATINVSQKGQTTGAVATTIPQLIAKIGETHMPSAVVLDAAVDYYFDAVVMNDVQGGNYTFNNLILATEGATAQHNGITLYGDIVAPTTLGVTKGDKVRVTLLKGLAKIQNYNGMYELTGDKDVAWLTVDKQAGTATVTPVTITPPQLAAFQGMAVSIDNASVSAPGVWANADAISSHTFSANGTDFAVFCKANATAFLDKPYAATTGKITGLAAVNRNTAQLVPRDMADVAAFNPTAPVITALEPDELSWGSAEVQAQTITVKGSDIDGKLSVTLSGGADSKFTAQVTGTTVTVTPKGTNTTAADFAETLTVAAAGGNSMTAALKQAKQGSSGDKTATFDFSTITTTGTAAPMTVDGITITPQKAAGQNPPGTNKSGEWRLYLANQLEVSGATITKIEITFTSASYMGSSFSAAPGAYATSGTIGTWTGNAANVVFTNGVVGGTNTQARMKKIEVTYTE